MTKKQIEVNDYTNNRTYEAARQIDFNSAMLTASLCDYIDVYIIPGAWADANAQKTYQRNQHLTIRYCTCTVKINNTQVDNGDYIIL